MTHLLTIPLLTAPTLSFSIDNAGSRTATSKIFAHFNVRIIVVVLFFVKDWWLGASPEMAEFPLRTRCLVSRPFILFRHFLNELFFMLLRIKSITEASVKPYCKRIISKGVRSSHAISMSRDRSDSVSGVLRPTQLHSRPLMHLNSHLNLDRRFDR